MTINKYLIATFIIIIGSFSEANELLVPEIGTHLVLEPGFDISIFASNLDAPRQMVEGKNGTIFVGERGGQIIALRDTDNNGQADFMNGGGVVELKQRRRGMCVFLIFNFCRFLIFLIMTVQKLYWCGR